MTRKSLFFSARCFVLLVLAGVVFGLALPAEAQDPTIDWIKIYKIPDSALQAKANAAGDRPVVAGVWPPAGFTNDAYGRVGLNKWRVEAYGYVDGYVKIDRDTGLPLDEDGSPLDEVTAETTLIADDILGIAIKINGPVNRVGASLDPDVLAGWDKGGPSGVSGSHQIHLNHFFDQSWHLDLPNNPHRDGNTNNLTQFTLLYCYRVRAGDQDLNGRWFMNNTPFLSGDLKADGRASVATTVQYADYASIVYPKIDAIAPELAAWQDHPVRFVSSSGSEIPHAPRGGKSRLHEIRLDCIAHDLQRGDDYTTLCPHVDEDGYSKPALAESRQVYYYGEGDTIYISVKFTEAVTVAPGDPPTLALGGSTLYGKHADYHSGSGTDTLVFAYTVEAGDYRFSDIQLYSAFRHNYRDANARRIIDSSGNRFAGGGIDTQSALVSYFIGERTPGGWTYGGKSQFHYNHILWSGDAAVRARLGDETSKMPLFLVDTLPATVWVPGLIKNGETHTDDKRNAVANLDAAYTEAPVTDFDRDVTESETQTAAFDVEFRFFNRFDTNYHIKTVLADEVGESFEPADVSISGTGVTREAWQVELTYVGLDHRSSEQWPPPGHWTETLRDYVANDWKRQHYIRRWPNEFDPSPLRTYDALHYPSGSAKNGALFLVYKATITPALGFQGNVAISLPAGATQDIAGNASLASNVLTVSVDNPLRVVETPAIVAPPAGAYTAGDKIEVEVTYDRENLRYEGENPPYLTLYLGEEVPANARHAVWTASEDTNSTKVTFAYTVAATDTVAEAVRVPSFKILVPAETMLLSGPLTAPAERQIGTEVPAAASGTAPKTVPAVEPLPLEDTSGRQVSPVVSDIPVVPYTPIFEESEPKAAASDVPRKPIVFNELGNGSGDADDWLELRNVTGSAVSLKDWELSVVQDGKKEDTSLIAFVEDVSVPANGLLLITHSDPTDEGNVLAGGDNVATAAVETKGSPHLYLVNAGLSLPDDGKFLLILRNAKEKLGLNEAFVDVAGGGGSDTDAFVREQTGDYDTHVWPLQVLQAPGGDTEDALGSGKVWQRAKADIVGYHKDAWAESAFTGIGYDRKVTESAATSGTPGYPNGAVKPGTATPKGSVTLSEIMFDSGGGTLPQWIELYNNSKTDAINLNRWQLELQNVDSEDLVGRPIVTLTLGEKVIQPNQTLLIVAGPARASSGSYLPADRVYDLLALHDKNLRIKSARDTFLSTEGFYLKLTDRNGHLVDEVGNTDGDRRSDDAPAWAVPLSGAEGSRSSLIRRYTDGTSAAAPGKKRSSWVLAARVKKVASSGDALYWGDADDIGTPGHREGGALPVELSSFSMTRNETGAVVLTWTTESEVDNAGFNLRRSEKRESGFTLLNPALIAGAGTTGERQTYTFTDTSAKPGIEYYYQIEEVAFDGKPATLVTRLLPGPVSAANRMLTTFGEVKKTK